MIEVCEAVIEKLTDLWFVINAKDAERTILFHFRCHFLGKSDEALIDEAFSLIGNVSRAQVPRPAELSISIVPSWRCITP